MATPYSIDLGVGSQEFLCAFLQHYANNADPWFIMDVDGRYFLHSRTVPDVFKMKNVTFCGKTDEDLGVLSKNYRRRNRRVRRLVINNSLRITTLEINLFYSVAYYTPLVYVTEPFVFGNGEYTITRMIDVCSLRRFNIDMDSVFLKMVH